MHQLWVPEKKYPNILHECMWILTWAWDRTRGSRLNNFYKKGKGKKKEENIWELITHGRQIQNETANSHATDTAILFKDRAGHHRPVTNTQSVRFLCLWPIHQCLSFPSYVIHVSPTYNIGTTTLRICKHFCLPPWQSHPWSSQVQKFLLGITETWLEKGGFAHFIEGNFLWWI